MLHDVRRGFLERKDEKHTTSVEGNWELLEVGMLVMWLRLKQDVILVYSYLTILVCICHKVMLHSAGCHSSVQVS